MTYESYIGLPMDDDYKFKHEYDEEYYEDYDEYEDNEDDEEFDFDYPHDNYNPFEECRLFKERLRSYENESITRK